MTNRSSQHSMNNLVLLQPDFTLKDAKKAGLIPQNMKEQSAESYDH